MEQNFCDRRPVRRRKTYHGFQPQEWEAQFLGKNCDEAANLIEVLSRQLGSKGLITVEGSARDRAQAHDYLVAKIDEILPIYLETDVSERQVASAVSFLGAYSKLQMMPPSHVFPVLVADIQTKMGGLNSDRLSSIPGYFASLAVYPGHDFISSWWGRSRSESGGWDLKDTYRVIYQLAILDFLAMQDKQGQTPIYDIVRPVMDMIGARVDLHFPDKVDSQIYYSALWFGYDFIEGRSIQESVETISAAEKFLAKGLEGEGLHVVDDHYIPGTQHRFDLVVAFNRKSVGIEIDGPFHFVYDNERNRMHYDGSTRFHTNLMAQMMGGDFRLLRIPYPQLDRKGAIENVRATIKHLNGFAKGEAYIMHGTTSVRPANEPNAWNIKMFSPS